MMLQMKKYFRLQVSFYIHSLFNDLFFIGVDPNINILEFAAHFIEEKCEFVREMTNEYASSTTVDTEVETKYTSPKRNSIANNKLLPLKKSLNAKHNVNK